jgi:uncharacterized membrane protein YhaH (DUF805 family)
MFRTGTELISPDEFHRRMLAGNPSVADAEFVAPGPADHHFGLYRVRASGWLYVAGRAVYAALRHLFDPYGRAGRQEFILYFLIVIGLTVLFEKTIHIKALSDSMTMTLITTRNWFATFSILPIVFVVMRRFRDCRWPKISTLHLFFWFLSPIHLALLFLMLFVNPSRD